MIEVSLSAILLAIAVPSIAYLKKALTMPASIEAAIMILLASMLDERCMWILIVAFALISLIDKCFKTKNRYVDNNITLKTGRRDWLQVFVNGGIASLSALIWLFYNSPIFVCCYVATIAEALADSASSSIGVALGGKSYNICTRREMPAGLSGGISVAGTAGGLIVCILICCLSYVLELTSGIETIIVIFCGFLGCVCDSILGASIQRKNICSKCGIVTEKKIHCMLQTDYYSGLPFVNNDIVNLISNSITAMITALLWWIIR